MSKSANVVDGEASESDTEIEIGRSPDASLSAKAFVVAGEAPESDDECKLPSPSSAHEVDVPLNLSMPRTPTSPNKMLYNSLLHQKLWECNVSLRATIEGLLKHTTEIAIEKLSRSDKTLLNAQESMRAINTNLTLARARLKQIHSELDKANCSSVLPTVKT